MKRLLLGLLVVSLLISACGVTKPTATPEPTRAPEATATARPKPATFEEAPCPCELPPGVVEGETVECGYLIVPEDRADPESRTIRLAVAIFRHPDGAPRFGPGCSALPCAAAAPGAISPASF